MNISVHVQWMNEVDQSSDRNERGKFIVTASGSMGLFDTVKEANEALSVLSRKVPKVITVSTPEAPYGEREG